MGKWDFPSLTGAEDPFVFSATITYQTNGCCCSGKAFSRKAVHMSTAFHKASSVLLLKLFQNDPTWDLSSKQATSLFLGEMMTMSQSFDGRKYPGRQFILVWIQLSGTQRSTAIFLNISKKPSICFPQVTAQRLPASTEPFSFCFSIWEFLVLQKNDMALDRSSGYSIDGWVSNSK